MQDTSKLMLTIVAGGVLLGLWVGQLASPTMQFAAQPEWRDRLQPSFSPTPFQFVNAGPEDLRPFGPAPRVIPAAHANEVAHALPVWTNPARQDAPIIKDSANEAALSGSPSQSGLSPQPEPLEIVGPGIVPEQ